MYEFRLPDVGEGIHEAEILAWQIKVGDTVKRDQPLLEIQTDKAVVEIPSPVAGIIAEIRAEPGHIAAVGELLVVIAPETAGVEQKAASPAIPGGWAASAAGIAGPSRRVLAAPAVRKLALELGIDLTQVAGSGPAGRVLPSDVWQAAQQVKPVDQSRSAPQESPPPPGETKVADGQPGPTVSVPASSPHPDQEIVEEETLHGLRRRIAERMELAWRVPQVTSFDEVDATHLVALRRRLQPEAERRGVRLTYLPFIIKATVQVLKEFPYFNATLDMERQKILLRRYYHLGVAMAIPEGLLVPVVRQADQKSLLQLAAELARLAEAARQRTLNLAELSGSTFTITNFGSFGSQQGTPIINPPEVAILGCGRIEEKPAVVEGQVVVRPVLPLALSFDHRLLDGAAAGAFLNRLKTLLADPDLLFLDMV